MWTKKNTGSWVDTFKARRFSTSSTASTSPSSSPRSSTFSIFSRSGSNSRSGSVASLGNIEEHEHLMAEQPKRAAYVPQHAAKSFMKTATSKEIRKKGEIL
ncbi:hypothetical protein LZ32DRAFT_656922 [Colletotrichum eremochloae]|uniref:Uncharacterized protein n=1 Tax=Colletotrichum sublineola TaxID=1173701 RepID=A0A066XHL6_COLSU|nr:hypothetical protein LY78DRAFT_679716 [Colletotrichum sublineola]KAK2014953.1 hypothetical protein LZ32DRAFT_656922 [Colletotrichum eremochloae]KDN68432.1 hypothetical protein CSUB01_09597 [Colletotrichum sublineola]